MKILTEKNFSKLKEIIKKSKGDLIFSSNDDEFNRKVIEKLIHGTLSTIREKVEKAKITRTALIFVGEVFTDTNFEDSALYRPEHRHIFRTGKKS